MAKPIPHTTTLTRDLIVMAVVMSVITWALCYFFLDPLAQEGKPIVSIEVKANG